MNESFRIPAMECMGSLFTNYHYGRIEFHRAIRDLHRFQFELKEDIIYRID